MWLVKHLVVTFLLDYSKAQFPVDCSLLGPAEAFCLELLGVDTFSRQNFAFLQARPQEQFIAPLVPSNIPNGPSFSPAVPTSNFVPSHYDCMNMQCLCQYTNGQFNNNVCRLPSGGVLQRAIRKEYRMMTNEERNAFHSAIQTLKNNGEYDRLSRIHQQSASLSGAHSGPAFLPWHREFLKRVEIAIRLVNPWIAIPYWDSVLDSYLPDPRTSILWTNLFAGFSDSYGWVIDGPFARFRTLEGQQSVRRNLGREGRLFTERDVNNVYSQNRIENMLAYTAPRAGCPFQVNYAALEFTHGGVHLWVGGDMRPIATSANDPIFLMHHAFIDMLFENWRQMRQNRFQREQDYSQDLPGCANPQHFSNAPMIPFGLANRQGLSNAYTDYMYTYAPRPQCNAQTRNCGSEYLFCDLRNGPPHCVSKIRLNGPCNRFEGEDACYTGICANGFCRPGTFNTGIRNASSAPNNRMTLRAAPIATFQADCFNDDPCCEQWAATGECRANSRYMRKFCRRSCKLCSHPMDNRRGCFDRHVACRHFRSNNYCTSRRQWMAENCRSTCEWCNTNPRSLCIKIARFSKI